MGIGWLGYFIREYAVAIGPLRLGFKTGVFVVSILLAVGSISGVYLRPQLEHQERLHAFEVSLEAVGLQERSTDKAVNILREMKSLDPEYKFSNGLKVGQELVNTLIREGNRYLGDFAKDTSGNVLILRPARQRFYEALAEEPANPEALWGSVRIEQYLEGDDAWGRGDWRVAARAFFVLHCGDPSFGGADFGQPYLNKPKAKALVAMANFASQLEKNGRPLDAQSVREIRSEMAQQENLDEGRCQLIGFNGM